MIAYKGGVVWHVGRDGPGTHPGIKKAIQRRGKRVLAGIWVFQVKEVDEF